MSFFKANSDGEKDEQIPDEISEKINEEIRKLEDDEVYEESTEYSGISKLMDKAKKVVKSTLKTTSELVGQSRLA